MLSSSKVISIHHFPNIQRKLFPILSMSDIMAIDLLKTAFIQLKKLIALSCLNLFIVIINIHYFFQLSLIFIELCVWFIPLTINFDNSLYWKIYLMCSFQIYFTHKYSANTINSTTLGINLNDDYTIWGYISGII